MKALPRETSGVTQINRRTLADTTNATDTNADVPRLAIPIRKGEVWTFEMFLSIGCNGAGGVNFALSLPTNVTHRTVVVGMAGSSTTLASSILTSSSSSANLNGVNSANGWARLTGIIDATADDAVDGIAQLRFKSGTDTQTSTVFKNSILNARRVA